MPSPSTEIAEAFSRHEFTRTFDHLAEDVRWVAHGTTIVTITSYTVELPG